MKLALIFVLFASAMLNATTLTFNPAFTTEGSHTEFAVNVLFEQEPGDVIRTTVTLTPGQYIGDLVAFYVNLTPLPSVSLTSIADAIIGADITDWATNTADVQGGNVGSVFSIGLAIGETGTGGGKGDIQSTQFTFNTPGLELQHISAVGVRVTSVGFENGKREYSRKMYGETEINTFDARLTAETPEPTTWALMATGLGLVVFAKRRSIC
jgi:hypothetical protein